MGRQPPDLGIGKYLLGIKDHKEKRLQIRFHQNISPKVPLKINR